MDLEAHPETLTRPGDDRQALDSPDPLGSGPGREEAPDFLEILHRSEPEGPLSREYRIRESRRAEVESQSELAPRADRHRHDEGVVQ